MTFEWNAPCYIRRAGWFIYANRIHYEYKTVERRYIQEEPRIKAAAKEKSHFSRKSTHFQFKHDLGTTLALARFEPAIVGFPFFFPTGQRLNKEKRSQESTKRFFPPHTSYTHKCYAFTRKNEHGLEIYVYGRNCYKFYKDELGLVANVYVIHLVPYSIYSYYRTCVFVCSGV